MCESPPSTRPTSAAMSHMQNSEREARDALYTGCEDLILFKEFAPELLAVLKHGPIVTSSGFILNPAPNLMLEGHDPARIVHYCSREREVEGRCVCVCVCLCGSSPLLYSANVEFAASSRLFPDGNTNGSTYTRLCGFLSRRWRDFVHAWRNLNSWICLALRAAPLSAPRVRHYPASLDILRGTRAVLLTCPRLVNPQIAQVLSTISRRGLRLSCRHCGGAAYRLPPRTSSRSPVRTYVRVCGVCV